MAYTLLLRFTPVLAVNPLKFFFQGKNTMNAEEWLTIGRIVAPQGLRGEVRVYPETDFPERFEEPGQRWLLRLKATEPEPVELESGRFLANKGLYVVQLAGVDDRSAAEALRGAQLLVAADDRPELAPGEFHYLDLVGLTVVDQASGQVVGTVLNLIAAGNDLLEVERSPDWLFSGIESETAAENSGLPQNQLENADAMMADPIDAQTQANIDAQVSETAEITAKTAAKIAAKTGSKAKAKAKAKSKSKPKAPPRLLIPFVESIVPVVDLPNQRLEITPPPGLLDLS
ncbi:MAG: ribosome maturation factor RimM [Prochlorothrix sp.]